MQALFEILAVLEFIFNQFDIVFIPMNIFLSIDYITLIQLLL